MNKRCALCGHPCASGVPDCPVCGGAAVLVPGAAFPGGLRVVGLVSLSPRAIVYRVESGGVPGEAALKVLRLPPSAQPVEALFPVARVRHPAVVETFGVGRGPDGLPFLLMAFLQGETLRAWLGREGPIQPPRAVDLAADVADGLAAVHGAGIVHGRIGADAVFVAKPAGRRGRVAARLLDFRPSLPTRARADDPVSFAGSPVGPETDLHALGDLVYESVAGVAPWHARQTDVPARRLVPMPLTLQCPDAAVPPRLDDLVTRLVLPPAGGPLPTAAGVARRLRGDGRQALAAVSRTTGRHPTVAVELWPAGSEFRGPLRDPVRLVRRVEQPMIEALLRDAADGRGTTLWLQGEEGAGLSTLGAQFLDLARARGFAAAGVSAAAPDPWGGVLEQFAIVPVPPRPEDVVAALAGDGMAGTRRALFLDDFESASPEAASILDLLCRRIEDRAVPLAVLVASRPPAPSPSGERMALHRAMGTVRGMGGVRPLARLPDRDVDILVESMCPLPCDAEVRSRVRVAADGNPHFAIRYLSHLASNGALVERDGLLSLAAGAPAGLPQDLADAVARRIQDLRERPGGPEALDVLVRIALLGPWAERDALRAMLLLEGAAEQVARLDDTLARLEAEGFVRQVPVQARRMLVMARPTDREVLAAGADVSAWTELVAAHVLRSVHDDNPGRVAVELGDHYERAGFPDHAVDCQVLAAGRALAEGRNAAAGERYLHAEALLDRLGDPDDPRWETVSVGLCEVLLLAGRPADAARRLERVRPHGDARGAERRLRLQALLDQCRGRRPEAREAWSLLAATSADPVGAADARMALARMALDDGRIDAARGWIVAVESGGVPAQSERVLGTLLLAKGRLAAAQGAVAEAFDLFGRALGVLTAPGDLPERSEALLERALLKLDLGHVDDAVDGFRTGVALCSQADYAAGRADHLTGLGRALALTGADEEGRRCVLRAMEVRERLGAPCGVARALVALAELALNRREPAIARQVGAKAAGLLADGGDVRAARQALLLLGQGCLAAGALDEAGRHLQACLLTVRAPQEVGVVLADAHVALARVRLRTGDADSARRHLLNAVVMFERLGLQHRAAEARALAAGE